jgi:tryptophan synthase alpha chain
MRELAAVGDGFIYCVARRGVTGSQTSFGAEFDGYLRRCRAATDLPLAVGFGIRDREGVAALEGKADIAVIGTRTIQLVEEQGPAAVGPFMRQLC